MNPVTYFMGFCSSGFRGSFAGREANEKGPCCDLHGLRRTAVIVIYARGTAAGLYRVRSRRLFVGLLVNEGVSRCSSDQLRTDHCI